jgi:hypothetical protein
MWPSLVKIQYTELKLSCGNDPVVRNSIYSNGHLDLWPNDPKINRVLPLPLGNHVAMFGKDPIYITKVIVWKPVWMLAIPNHIIRPVSRRAYKNKIQISFATKMEECVKSEKVFFGLWQIEGHNSRTEKVVKSKIEHSLPFMVQTLCINFKWFTRGELTEVIEWKPMWDVRCTGMGKT